MAGHAADLLSIEIRGLAAHRDLYAIVDLASAPGGLTAVAGKAHDDGLCLFDHALADRARNASPWLIPLDNAGGDRRLARSCALARRAPAVVWLASDLPVQALFQRLERRLDVRFADGTELLLRYFDPRILDLLHAHLEPANRASLFRAAHGWVWLDRDGMLQRHEADDAALADEAALPMQLTATEEAALVAATQAGQVLTQTLARWPADLMRLNGSARFALARRACAQADALRLHSLSRQVQLLMLAAAHGADYFDGPAWPTHAARIAGDPEELVHLLDHAPQTTEPTTP
jgi:hypothetical protein